MNALSFEEHRTVHHAGFFLVGWPLLMGPCGTIPRAVAVPDAQVVAWASSRWSGTWEVVARFASWDAAPCECGHARRLHAGALEDDDAAAGALLCRCRFEGCGCAAFRAAAAAEQDLLSKLGIVGRCRLARAHAGECSPLGPLTRCACVTWGRGHKFVCRRDRNHGPPHVWATCEKLCELPRRHAFGLAVVGCRCLGCGALVVRACASDDAKLEGAPCLLDAAHLGQCLPMCSECLTVATETEMVPTGGILVASARQQGRF